MYPPGHAGTTARRSGPLFPGWRTPVDLGGVEDPFLHDLPGAVGGQPAVVAGGVAGVARGAALLVYAQQEAVILTIDVERLHDLLAARALALAPQPAARTAPEVGTPRAQR